MKIATETFTVHKRFALRISRGTTGQTSNIWLKISQDGLEGWGEASPISLPSSPPQSTEYLLEVLAKITPQLQQFNAIERQKINLFLQEVQAPSALVAAIDTALWDWLGKKANLPLWQIWGLDGDKKMPTSVTVGISSPLGAQERVKSWLSLTSPQLIKIKLGSSEGIEADQTMFLAVQEVAGDIPLSVDANAGYSSEQAILMSKWLSQKGVVYLEQPLAVGDIEGLKKLSSLSLLPIILDESCSTAQDILLHSPYIQGVNLKMMKMGGLSRIMPLIHLAQSLDLLVMFGCYSDSSLANTALAQLGSYAEYLDLDSHLNLLDDPFSGVLLKDGYLQLNNEPGLGINHVKV